MPLYSKNLLQDTGSIDSSNLWIKENGVNYCYKTGEKFKGADVYRVSFDPTNNGRVFQLFDTKGIVSASLWVKYLQYDTTLVLTLREQNFGISAGLVSINQEIYDWQQIKLENALISTDKPYMFALYKSGKTQVKEVIVEFAMTQLEKGSQATNFEPYELGMKKVRRIEKINEDMTGSASHAYPFGNVISVKEDVRLWNAKLKVYTTGTFNISVYEWKEWNGGRVGAPLFDKKMNITSLTDFTYSFDGLELKAGKKYWIGRLSTDPESTDSAGNAAVGRSTGMPASAFKYIDTLGGTSFRAQTVDFTSTWYYFYGLEVEAIGMKKATLVPKKNLAKPFGDTDWVNSFTTASFNITSPTRLEMLGTASQGYAKLIFSVKPNTNYTFSAKHNAKIGIYSSNGGSSISGYTSGDGNTFNSGSYTEVAFYFSNNGLGAGLYYLEELQIEEGVRTPFKPYELTMKPASLVPKKNLIPRQNLVHGSWQGSPLALNSGSPLYKAIPAPFRLKPGTYYVSTRGDVTAAVLTSSGVLFGTNDTLPRPFTLTSETDVYMHFRKKDSTTWDAATFPIDTHELGIQLEQGTQTEYKSYDLGMKPAILYPKKNMVSNNPDDWTQGKIGGNAQPDDTVTTVSRYKTFIPVKPSTTYTISQPERNLYMEIHEMPKSEYGVRAAYKASFNTPYTFKTDAATNFIILCVTTPYIPDVIKNMKLQLEEGSVQTPYEKYELGMKPN